MKIFEAIICTILVGVIVIGAKIALDAGWF